MQEDFAWGVDVGDEDNVYWATSQTISGPNVKDILTYKINSDGDELWPEPHGYGGQYEQQAYNAVLKDNILYVGGRTWTQFFNLASSDALVFALDVTTRDTLWSWIWDGGFGYEEVDGMVIEDDAIYITGWTRTEFDDQDAFITKLNLDGSHVWTRIWGSPNYDQCDGHCVVDDSTVYICGLYDLSIADAYLAAFDKFTGDYKWHRLWGGFGFEDALGMGSDGDFLYQCGTTSSFPDSSVFLNKYDKNGNLIWSKLTNMAIKSRSLAFGSNERLYLAATTDNLGAGKEDIIILEYDTGNGDLLKYKTWGGSENESVQDIRIKDDHMYLTGRTVSFSTNNLNDAFLVKAPLFKTTSVGGVGETNSLMRVFPNPACEQLRLTSLNTLHGEFTLIDVTGREILRETVHAPEQEYDVSKLETGLYFWQFHLENDGYVNGKIVIH